MPDRSFLTWPFFENRHRALAAELDAWCAEHIAHRPHPDDEAGVDAECRALVRLLGEGGWLRYAAPSDVGQLDVRSLCLIRETLARWSGLADFAFAMQGLGTGTVQLFGSPEQRAWAVGGAATGARIAAFALTELTSGSDVAAMETSAERVHGGWVVNGAKTYISNGGIADHYVLFARTGEAPGAKGISAFLVAADAPGLTIAERIRVIAPHPLATLRFENMELPADALIGEPGRGFAQAMATLDIFRPTVGAAALGFARRALDEATARAQSRRLFGGALAENAVVQQQIAEMAVDVDASALLIYRAAWVRDVLKQRNSREAAMAKLYATDHAQAVIDKAVQIHGGLGVVHGHPVESLYREVRALRIYEGASEVQKLVIARAVLAASAPPRNGEVDAASAAAGAVGQKLATPPPPLGRHLPVPGRA
ncbi:MAG: acyl-CoA dehydrogenase family protein [Sphingomonadaceae bacterium]|nr:acyl-CoA dehydrogenase family protein [Sphingomonadaceae bacterium]